MTADRIGIMTYYASNITKLFAMSDFGMAPLSGYTHNPSQVETWKTREFYDSFSNHPQFVSDGGWALFPVSPDPFEYFLARFGRIPIITSEDVGSASEYLAAIHEAPPTSPADALATVGEVILCCSRYGSALYYFNQMTDAALEFVSEVQRPFPDAPTIAPPELR